jgi:RNA polymerase sigma factor (TIGR02999 family)
MDPLKELLQKAHEGNEAARGQLFAAAYEELRSRARAQLQGGGRNTLLDTTALVHESYLRYLRSGSLSGAERGYFFAYAAHVMRSVIVDYARQRQAQRRGGNAVHLTLTTQFADNLTADEDQLVRINDALDELQKLDERLARVVEMRYFAGMTETEVAAVMGVTERTIRRDWRKAKLLLAESLR